MFSNKGGQSLFSVSRFNDPEEEEQRRIELERIDEFEYRIEEVKIREMSPDDENIDLIQNHS